MSKKWLALVLKVCVSGALIWYLIGKVDLDTAMDRLVRVDPLMLFVALAMVFVQALIAGLRWGAVLRAMGAALPLWETTRLFYIGMFFGQALPGGTGGDPIRMYMAHKDGLELKHAINGVMLERVAAVAALVLLVVAMTPSFLPKLDDMTRELAMSGVAMVAAAAVGGIIFLCMLDRLPARLQHWRIVRGLGYLGGDTRRVFLNLRNVVEVLFWGIAGHLNISLCVFVLASGLGLDVTFFDCVVLMPPVLLIVTLPISVGGWGVREGAMVTAFGLVGVAQEGALVLSLLLGLIFLVGSLPGGFVWLAGREKGQGLSGGTTLPAVPGDENLQGDEKP